MTYNVQLSVTVRGRNLWAPQFEFVKVEDGQEIAYTPIGGTAESPIYLLTDNGTYRIYCNGSRVRKIVIDGLVMPAKEWRRITMRQKGNLYQDFTDTANEMFSEGYCINYPYRITGNYPYFLARFTRISGIPVDFSEISFYNARMLSRWSSETQDLFIFEPIDPTLVAVVEWKSVICIVTNYEQSSRRRR